MVHPGDPTTAFWALGSQSFSLASGIWSYSQSAAQIGLGNFAHSLRPTDTNELDADLRRLATEPEHRCRRIVIDRVTPTWVEAHLVMREWKRPRT